MRFVHRFLALLRPRAEAAFDPKKSDEARLVAFRALWGLTGLSILFTAAIYPLTDLVAPRDPLWTRYLVGDAPLALLFLSYTSATVRRRFAELTYALLYLLMAWAVALTTLHAFSADYSVWLLFSFGGLGLAHSIGLDRSALLAAFLTYAAALASIAVVLTPNPMVSPVLFIGGLACFALVLHLALSARKLAEEDLVESEQRNRAVLTQTTDGVCLIDVETHRFRETNPAFRAMVGYTAEELHARTIHDLSADRASAVEARIQDLLASDGPVVGQRVFRHKDGSRVEVGFGVSEISYGDTSLLCMVAHDIQEQKRTERALRRAKGRAEETARAKSALLNNVSHELRTPLSGILGFADILAEEVDAEHREFAQLIAENGRRLQKTINSVMDLAKLESDTAELDLQTLDLKEEARDAADLLTPVAEEQDLYLNVVEQTSAPIHAQLDRAALSRILHNVLGNALKFTDSGGVTVTLDTTDGGAARVRIRDTGIGMEEDFRTRLFEEFEQESSGLTRSHDGIGIGMTITRRLVELMDGEIAVESEKGVGSTFTLRFPPPRRAAGPPAVAGETARICEMHNDL